MNEAFERVLSIPNAKFDFPLGMKEFIEYLSIYGYNRYWEFPSYTSGYELSDLDLAVWNIRRYCQPITEASVYDSLNGPDAMRSRHKMRLAGGFLESVLVEGRKKNLRTALVWKNGCYGSRRRDTIRNYPVRIRSTNPVHFRDTRCYSALKGYVAFPTKKVREELELLTRRSSK